jgi:hypothetical protein
MKEITGLFVESGNIYLISANLGKLYSFSFSINERGSFAFGKFEDFTFNSKAILGISEQSMFLTERRFLLVSTNRFQLWEIPKEPSQRGLFSLLFCT